MPNSREKKQATIPLYSFPGQGAGFLQGLTAPVKAIHEIALETNVLRHFPGRAAQGNTTYHECRDEQGEQNSPNESIHGLLFKTTFSLPELQ